MGETPGQRMRAHQFGQRQPRQMKKGGDFVGEVVGGNIARFPQLANGYVRMSIGRASVIPSELRANQIPFREMTQERHLGILLNGRVGFAGGRDLIALFHHPITPAEALFSGDRCRRRLRRKSACWPSFLPRRRWSSQLLSARRRAPVRLVRPAAGRIVRRAASNVRRQALSGPTALFSGRASALVDVPLRYTGTNALLAPRRLLVLTADARLHDAEPVATV